MLSCYNFLTPKISKMFNANLVTLLKVGENATPKKSMQVVLSFHVFCFFFRQFRSFRFVLFLSERDCFDGKNEI